MPKDGNEHNMEHIKYLENIIFNLRNDLKKSKLQNRELREENRILRRKMIRNGIDNGVASKNDDGLSRSVEKNHTFSRAPQHHLASSMKKYKKVEYSGSKSLKREERSVEQDDNEEVDSFLEAEQKANDEIMQNPSQDPIVELLSLKNGEFSSVERRKRSNNFRSTLKPSISVHEKSSGVFDEFKDSHKTFRKGDYNDNDMFGFDDEEPLPLPQQAPSFIENKVFITNSEEKGVHKQKLIQNDDKYVRRVKGNFKPNNLLDKTKNENSKKRLYERSPMQKYGKEDFSCQIKNSNNLKDQSSGIPNQKKAFVKEVSVHLNSLKPKKYSRENSMPETHRAIHKESLTGSLNGPQTKKSTLYKPTIAYRQKKEATLNERMKKIEKKKQEMKKMVAPTSGRFVTGNIDSSTQDYFLYDTRESSPTIEVKEYPR